jgi:RHS repeat-associated protein
VPPALATATYNANNQQTVFGTSTETYDLNGNLATTTDAGVTTTYTWNARNQLTGISRTGLTASFTYDSFGRRTGRTVNGTTTNYVYDGLNPVQEKNGTTVTANLLTGLGIDEFFTRTDGVDVRSLLSDTLGSTIALGDGTGTLQTQYTYEPFGLTTYTGSASTSSYKFTGREDDGSGLYYYRARYYQPRFQRFIAEDPIGLRGGANFYGYAFNNPINLSDPLGLYPNCGSGWQIYVIPDLSLSAACAAHDKCYGRCAANKDQCDKQFLIDMMSACKATSNFGVNDCYATALLYYSAVRTLGSGAFRRAQAQCSGCSP